MVVVGAAFFCAFGLKIGLVDVSSGANGPTFMLKQSFALPTPAAGNVTLSEFSVDVRPRGGSLPNGIVGHVLLGHSRPLASSLLTIGATDISFATTDYHYGGFLALLKRGSGAAGGGSNPIRMLFRVDGVSATSVFVSTPTFTSVANAFDVEAPVRFCHMLVTDTAHPTSVGLVDANPKDSPLPPAQQPALARDTARLCNGGGKQVNAVDTILGPLGGGLIGEEAPESSFGITPITADFVPAEFSTHYTTTPLGVPAGKAPDYHWLLHLQIVDDPAYELPGFMPGVDPPCNDRQGEPSSYNSYFFFESSPNVQQDGREFIWHHGDTPPTPDHCNHQLMGSEFGHQGLVTFIADLGLRECVAEIKGTNSYDPTDPASGYPNVPGKAPENSTDTPPRCFNNALGNMAEDTRREIAAERDAIDKLDVGNIDEAAYELRYSKKVLSDDLLNTSHNPASAAARAHIERAVALDDRALEAVHDFPKGKAQLINLINDAIAQKKAALKLLVSL